MLLPKIPNDTEDFAADATALHVELKNLPCLCYEVAWNLQAGFWSRSPDQLIRLSRCQTLLYNALVMNIINIDTYSENSILELGQL